MLESLESRRLLAVSVSATGGVLTINGDKNDNVINVIENAHSVHVETSTLPGGAITQQDFTGITAIKINGGAGADHIFYDSDTVGADIHGDNAGNGSDAKNNKGGSKNGWNGGSSGGSSNNNGGGSGGGKSSAGNDEIVVTDDGSATTTLDGDGGADSLTVVHGNNTVAFGGDGNDQFFLNTDGEASGSTISWGEAGNDTFTVYAGNNTVHGGAGNDIIYRIGGTVVADSATVQ